MWKCKKIKIQVWKIIIIKAEILSINNEKFYVYNCDNTYHLLINK